MPWLVLMACLQCGSTIYERDSERMREHMEHSMGTERKEFSSKRFLYINQCLIRFPWDIRIDQNRRWKQQWRQTQPMLLTTHCFASKWVNKFDSSLIDLLFVCHVIFPFHRVFSDWDESTRTVQWEDSIWLCRDFHNQNINSGQAIL